MAENSFRPLMPAVRLHPSSARTPSQSPSRSPEGKAQLFTHELDPLLANLSPKSILKLLSDADAVSTNEKVAHVILAKSIAHASTAERALGIRAAVAHQKLKEWHTEILTWEWPQGSDAGLGKGFLSPSWSSDISGSDAERTSTTVMRSFDEDYLGCLPTAVVERYEKRLDEIKDGMEALDVEELKEHVLNAHVPSRSRPASNSAASASDRPLSYVQLSDFTAVITATILQTLPLLSKINILLNTWDARLTVLRQIPGLLEGLRSTERAIDSSLARLEMELLPDLNEPLFSKQSFKSARQKLEHMVLSLGSKMDAILDTLEGREDSLPETWIDRMETIETDFAIWAFEAEKRSVENEWKRNKLEQRVVTVEPTQEPSVFLQGAAPMSERPASGNLAASPAPMGNGVSVEKDVSVNSCELEPPVTLNRLSVSVSGSLRASSASIENVHQIKETLSKGMVLETDRTRSSAQREEAQLQGYEKTASMEHDTEISLLNPHSSSLTSSLYLPVSRGLALLPGDDLYTPLASFSATGSSTKSPLKTNAADLIPVASLETKGDEGSELEPHVGSQGYPPEQPDVSNYGDMTQNGDGTMPDVVEIARGTADDEAGARSMRLAYQNAPGSGYISSFPSPSLTREQRELSHLENAVDSLDGSVVSGSQSIDLASSSTSLPSNSDGGANILSAPISSLTPLPQFCCDPSEFLDSHRSATSSAPNVHESPSANRKANPEQLTLETPARGTHCRGDSRVSPTSSIASRFSLGSDPEIRDAQMAESLGSPVVVHSPVTAPKGDNCLSKPRVSSDQPLSNGNSLEDTADPGFDPSWSFSESRRSSIQRHTDGWVSPDEADVYHGQAVPEIKQASTTSIEILRKAELRSIVLPRRRSFAPITEAKPTPALRRAASHVTVSSIRRQLSSKDLKFREHSFRTQVSDGLLDTDGPIMCNDSLRLTRAYDGRNGLTQPPLPSTPPTIPHRPSKRFSTLLNTHLQLRSRRQSNGTTVSPLNTSSTAVSVNSPDTMTVITSSKSSEDHLEEKISSILTTIPARIHLASAAEHSYGTSTIDHFQSNGRQECFRSTSPSPISTRSTTPTLSLTLTPAFSRSKRSHVRPDDDSSVRLYHLHRGGKAAPVKLFVRSVGEDGERVMVRVGGGWADLGEYLREYAVHHRRQAVSDARFEIQGIPANGSAGHPSQSKPKSSPNNGRSTPFSRPGSAFDMRPSSSLAIRKTRRPAVTPTDLPSLTMANVQKASEVSPPHSFLSARRRLSVSSTNSMSVASTAGESAYTSTPLSASTTGATFGSHSAPLGLAGPKPRSRQVSMSPESEAWVEDVVGQARKTSSTLRPERSSGSLRGLRQRDEGQRSRTDSKFRSVSDIGSVGLNKRVFLRGLDRRGG